jgi:hypothetical protein
MFHLNNSQQKRAGENGFDAILTVRPLFQKQIDKFQQIYYPDETITVDEVMCEFKGRVSFRVYMPQKANKYGTIYSFWLNHRQGYIWKFEMYHREDPELDKSAS